MSETTTELMYEGEDDRISEEGLNRLLELSEKLPREFDVGATTGHQKSVNVTRKFPGNDPLTQLEHLHNVLTASQFVGTLARNLRFERSLRP